MRKGYQPWHSAALEYQAQWRWQGVVWDFFAVVAHRERLRAIRRRIIGATDDIRKVGEAFRKLSSEIISLNAAFAAIHLYYRWLYWRFRVKTR